MSATDAHDAVQAAAREHYGRLLAVLARRTGDLPQAQDVLSDAFAQALQTWPSRGIPDHPDAWLLSVARNELKERWRHDAMAKAKSQFLADEIESLMQQAYAAPQSIADERLRLMLVCAHPAIDKRIRSALMLQVILGMEVQQIAGAFLVAPATLAQRLVRAKQKIRAAGIPFEIPEAGELPERMHDVLEAIYGAYTCGGAIDEDSSLESMALAREAMRLAEVLVEVCPDDAEAIGLRAILLYCEARRPARFNAAGNFIPLGEQDTSLWRKPGIEAAEELLKRASRLGVPGPMQLEAAIQSAHCSRQASGVTPWAIISAMYDALCARWPSIGTVLGSAVAHAECGRLEVAESLLDSLPTADTENHLAYYAVRGHLYKLAGQSEQSRSCFSRATGLAKSNSIRTYFLGRSSEQP